MGDKTPDRGIPEESPRGSVGTPGSGGGVRIMSRQQAQSSQDRSKRSSLYIRAPGDSSRSQTMTSPSQAPYPGVAPSPIIPSSVTPPIQSSQLIPLPHVTLVSPPHVSSNSSSPLLGPKVPGPLPPPLPPLQLEGTHHSSSPNLLQNIRRPEKPESLPPPPRPLNLPPGNLVLPVGNVARNASYESAPSLALPPPLTLYPSKPSSVAPSSKMPTSLQANHAKQLHAHAAKRHSAYGAAGGYKFTPLGVSDLRSVSPPPGESALDLDAEIEVRPKRSGSEAPRVTVLVAKHPFLDVLRISGQKKTLVIDSANATERICGQMGNVVCRPLQKGAVSSLVTREIETFSIAIEEGGNLRFLENESLSIFAAHDIILKFAEKPILAPQLIQNNPRLKIINEMIETERSYISGLLEMYQFRIGLTRGVKKLAEKEETKSAAKKKKSKAKDKDKDELTEADVDSVFGNLEKLIELNGNFYLTLKERARSWSDNQTIGDCFISLVQSGPPPTEEAAEEVKVVEEKKPKGGKNLVSRMNAALADWAGEEVADIIEKEQEGSGAKCVYAQWGKNYNHAIAVYEKMKANAELVDKLRNLKRSLDLDAILIMPIQRLPRYSLLLNDLIRHTDKSHCDYANLQTAAELIQELTFHVDDQIKAMQNLSTDVLKDHPWLKTYLSVNRTLHSLLKTTVRRKNLGNYQTQIKFPSNDERIIIYLFDDLLLYVLEDEQNALYEVPLHLVWVRGLDRDPERFEIITPLLLLSVSCLEGAKVKLQWVPLLRRTLRVNYNKASGLPPKEDIDMDAPDVRVGESTLPGGGMYQGEWDSGEMCGSGSLSVGGSSFSGMWKNAQRNGKGKGFFSDGSVYDGMWRDDMMEGQGSLVTSIGDRYVGSFSGSQRHGSGNVTFANGDTFEGEWQLGLPHGTGVLVQRSEGFTYAGEFRGGLFNGFGKLTGGGTDFSGLFVDGMKEGRGSLRLSCGRQYEGDFAGNLYHGSGVLLLPDGSKYTGDFENGLMHGEGTLIRSNGTAYSGSFRKGLKCGRGTLTLPGGVVFTGNFKSGKMHGAGSLRTNDVVLEGQWKFGIKDGLFSLKVLRTLSSSDEMKKRMKGKQEEGNETATYREGVCVSCSSPEILMSLNGLGWYMETPMEM